MKSSIQIFFILLLTVYAKIFSQNPNVLIITAHPDDETGFAATIYKITHDLEGKADIIVITNGEAGYKYSSIAQDIYNIELTKEAIGREYLPSIRKKELMSGGAILGLREYYFLDQKDTYYTLDADSVLRHVWDTTFIKRRIQQVLNSKHYDFIFTLLPTNSTHGHHKAATILALSAVQEFQSKSKPVIVGCTLADSTAIKPEPFLGLQTYPITAVKNEFPSAQFNRNQSFGYNNKLNYSIIANLVIAEHKSQGAMQLAAGKGDIEYFWNYSLNSQDSELNIKQLFDRMALTPFKQK